MIEISPDMLAVDEIEEGSYSPEARMNLGIIGINEDPAYDALIESSYEWEKHVGLEGLGIGPTGGPEISGSRIGIPIEVARSIVGLRDDGSGASSEFVRAMAGAITAAVRRNPELAEHQVWNIVDGGSSILINRALWSQISSESMAALPSVAPVRRSVPVAPGRIRMLVRDLQTELARIGASLGPSGIDGLWGPYTQRAFESVVNTVPEGTTLNDHYRAVGRYIDIDVQLWEALQEFESAREDAPTPNGAPPATPTEGGGGGFMLGILGIAALIFLGTKKIEMDQ